MQYAYSFNLITHYHRVCHPSQYSQYAMSEAVSMANKLLNGVMLVIGENSLEYKYLHLILSVFLLSHHAPREIDTHVLDTHVIDAHLIDAHVIDAHLIDAHLIDAHLINVHVIDARVIDAHLIDAHVIDAHAIDAHVI